MEQKRASEAYIATAAWSIPAAYRSSFSDGASILHRYASRFNAVEINSSFYRPHQRKTYERWAESVGAGFRFAVKAPRTITHERRLVDCREEALRFADEIGGLGSKLGAVLVQLPPNLAFRATVVIPFLQSFVGLLGAPIVCEPRHVSWFSGVADGELERLGVARVAADPFIVPEANVPSGDKNIVYYRLHGSPEIYASDYPQAELERYAGRLREHSDAGVARWCIFDNTIHGHATANAMAMAALMMSPREAATGSA